MKHCFYNESVGFFYNNSRKELTTYWRTKDILVVALGLTVSLIVLLTNLLVIAAIIINRRFHYPIYYLLGNLAAADLFAGIAYMFLMFHTGPRTAELSLKTWFIRQSLLDTSLTASVVNLLAIAVERHQTVLTMQLHSKMSNQRVMILIFCIWATALLLGLIPSYGWHCLCALEECSSMAPLYSRSYLTFWAISNLLVFLLMAVVYAHIFIYVKRKMGRMSAHTSFHPRYRETVVGLVKTVTIILGELGVVAQRHSLQSCGAVPTLSSFPGRLWGHYRVPLGVGVAAVFPRGLWGHHSAPSVPHCLGVTTEFPRGLGVPTAFSPSPRGL